MPPLAPLPPHLAPYAPLLEAIAAIIRDEIATVRSDATPTFVDKATSGLGPSVFMAAARAGEFETFRVGKRFVARAADVLAYIERQRITPRPTRVGTTPRLDELDVQLAGRVRSDRRNRVAGSRTSSEP